MTALDLTTNVYFDNPFDTTGFEVIITPADETLFYLATMPSNKWQFPCFLNAVADPANGIFNTIQDAIDYNITANSTAILAYFAGLTPPIVYTSIGTVYKNIYNGILNYGVPETRTINGHALSANIALTAADMSLAAVASSGSYNDLSNKPSIPNTARTSSALTLSLAGTGATGTQISATKDSSVRVTYTTSTTVTLSSSPTSTVTLKICATNSSTEANWTEVGRTESDQPTTLAITVSQQVKNAGQICADVPAGWFVKAVNSGTGTHAEAFVSGQQTIYG